MWLGVSEVWGCCIFPKGSAEDIEGKEGKRGRGRMNHKTCGECKYTTPFPHLSSKTDDEILLMCTQIGSGYYKVCKRTMACNKFEKKSEVGEG